MQPAQYLPIILLFVILYIMYRGQKAAVVRQKLKKRKTEDKIEMIELAKRFIGKECVVCFFDGNQRTGVITEVANSALLLEKNGSSA